MNPQHISINDLHQSSCNIRHISRRLLRILGYIHILFYYAGNPVNLAYRIFIDILIIWLPFSSA